MRGIRFAAFIALLPIYAVGGFGLLLMCGLADEDLWEDWPLEARCLVGYAAPVLIPAALLALLSMFLWDALND